jgi:hypothetical protein
VVRGGTRRDHGTALLKEHGLAADAWDVDPSGKRFILIRRAESAAASQTPRPRIEIVLNWAEELKARLPVK